MKQPDDGIGSDAIRELTREIARLARQAPDQLARRVAGLSLREQADLALRLPPAERLALLLHAPQPMRLVRALPDIEFYLTVRELGPLESLPLIALGGASQLQHLFDLESWRHDRFDAARSGAWTALILDAGEPALKRFLRGADDELLALLFLNWAGARQLPVPDELETYGRGQTETGDEHGFMSPDGFHHFSPIIEEHAPAVQRLMRFFFVEQPERYRQILWDAHIELPSSLEEGALRWRNSRLEEHGFPPWEEALQVYAPPCAPLATPAIPEPSDPDGLAVARLPLRLSTDEESLAQAVDSFPPQLRERVLHEMLSLGNRLLVADGADTGDPTAHRAALGKGADYVTIALAARNVRREELAALLERTSLAELFREGYERAVELQREARWLTRDGWAQVHPRSLQILDPPLRQRVECLLEPRPMYFEIDGSVAQGRLRPFRSLLELDETRLALEMSDRIGGFLVQQLGLDVAAVVESAESRSEETPLCSTFMLTLLAWHATRGQRRGEPLPPTIVADFLRDVASRRTAAADAPQRAYAALLVELVRAARSQPREISMLRAFGKACLERLSDECGKLDPARAVDRSTVSCLLLEPARSD